MPKISEFFGISIYIYYDDHAPPHFHAIYGGQEGVIRIDPPGLLRGGLPPRVLGMVLEWSTLHHSELVMVWKQAEASEPLSSIPPLE